MALHGVDLADIMEDAILEMVDQIVIEEAVVVAVPPILDLKKHC